MAKRPVGVAKSPSMIFIANPWADGKPLRGRVFYGFGASISPAGAPLCATGGTRSRPRELLRGHVRVAGALQTRLATADTQPRLGTERQRELACGMAVRQAVDHWNAGHPGQLRERRVEVVAVVARARATGVEIAQHQRTLPSEH